ncbi:hypothetical protein HDU93_003877, partial [Gonapodya sp. JEL0774]
MEKRDSVAESDVMFMDGWEEDRVLWIFDEVEEDQVATTGLEKPMPQSDTLDLFGGWSGELFEMKEEVVVVNCSAAERNDQNVVGYGLNELFEGDHSEDMDEYGL